MSCSTLKNNTSDRITLAVIVLLLPGFKIDPYREKLIVCKIVPIKISHCPSTILRITKVKLVRIGGQKVSTAEVNR